MDRNDHTGQLKDLHALITDSRKGYEEAAKQVDSQPLRHFLQRLSAQRISMQAELAAEVHRFDPEEELQDGTVKGTLHRAWMDIREALGSSDDVNMLDECERGEQYLLQRFNSVLAHTGLVPSTNQLLTIQRQQVSGNLVQVKELRAVAKQMEQAVPPGPGKGPGPVA